MIASGWALWGDLWSLVQKVLKKIEYFVASNNKRGIIEYNPKQTEPKMFFSLDFITSSRTFKINLADSFDASQHKIKLIIAIRSALKDAFGYGLKDAKMIAEMTISLGYFNLQGTDEDLGYFGDLEIAEFASVIDELGGVIA